MKKPCRFEVGEVVSLQRWDATEPKLKRLGDCVIASITEDRCESGWMIKVENPSGRSKLLDSNWLTKKATVQECLL